MLVLPSKAGYARNPKKSTTDYPGFASRRRAEALCRAAKAEGYPEVSTDFPP